MKTLPLFLALCAALAPLSSAAAESFDEFIDRLTLEWVRLDPQAATERQFFTGAEQDALDRQLTPVSGEFIQQRAAMAGRVLAGLQHFDRRALSANQRVSAAMLQWQMEEVIGDAKYNDYNLPFNQIIGAQAGIISYMDNAHPLRNVRDAENYLARLEQIPALIEQLLVQARAREAKGIRPPDFILQATIGQMERLISPAPKDNLLVTSLGDRLAKLPTVSAAARGTFSAAAEKTVADAIYPAYRRAIEFLQSQQPKATSAAGLSRLPGGEEAYAYFLKKYTTTDLTAAQVHEIGLKEVARLEQEMDVIFKQLGLSEGSINQRFRQLVARSQFPGTEDEQRTRMLATYEQTIRDAEKRCETLFDIRPKAPVVVKREPAFSERNAAAHYTPPAKDGSRPGIFWAVLPELPFNTVALRTLAYHEAVPGHHFQFALQAERTDLPRFRSDAIFGFISAHGEGWALYAERLAAENNWYEGDPVGRIGQLGSALFRAKRLVVDTGLHTKQWTRQRAIDYGMPAAEVERYVVWPGQACSYKVGELKILALREKVKQALGAKFDLKQFHNLVLRTGGVPLAVLEQLIDDWVASIR